MPESSGPDPAGSAPDRRKLIAVVYADMAGYSRLIGLDEAGTLQRLRSLRLSVIDPAIEEHGGSIVQTGATPCSLCLTASMGRCAVPSRYSSKFRSMMAINTPDRAIRFRMGINIGDAIADGTDLHGDAVNVAARLQAECPTGGICVSRAVRDHVHDRLDLHFEDLGRLGLKNISRQVEAFVIRPGAATTAKSVERSLLGGAGDALPLPDKPSIAVLAFTNMSGGPARR